METKRLCPSCQKPLAPNVPMGLCPECLIKAGFPTGVATDTGSAKQPAFVPPAVGEIARLFPQLEILELVGKGGMGAVYKARQKRLNRFVALKILPPGIGSEPAFAERFTREAQALAQLNHPGIVTLYEFGETSGQFYFLMEFVDGVNLRQLLHAGRIAPREALAIVPQICDALQFAHDQGIVHRDIKPENILLDRRGRVKVADFGLAKIVEGRAGSPLHADAADDANGAHGVTRPTSELTDAGKVMGTPNYMSPEQIEHPDDVDNRADIYALGVVFYQMLTGELPGKKIAPPSTKVQIDVRLDEIVLRALEQKPELRYQQVSEVKTMVETIVSTPPGGAGVPPAEPGVAPGSPSGKIISNEPPVATPVFQPTVQPKSDLFVRFSVRAIYAVAIFIAIWPVIGVIADPGDRGHFVRFALCLPMALGVAIVGKLFSLVVGALLKHNTDEARTSPATRHGINRREEAQTEKPEIGNRKSEMSPRFSRTAIVGSAWLTLFFAVVPVFLWHEVNTHEFEKRGPFPSVLMVFVFFVFIFPAFIAPFGTTILGWIAVSQIRRSAGKLHGLWLAVFDGLLFPLLALIGLSALMAAKTSELLVEWLTSPVLGPVANESSPFVKRFNNFLAYHPGVPLAAGACLGAVVSFFIIRRVWRVVNKGGAGVPPAEPVRKSSPVKIIAIGCCVVAAILLILTAWNLSSKRAVEAQQQMRGALQNELGNKLAELLGNNEQRITYSHLSFDYVADAPCIVVQFGGL
jgi:serine/threonine protein kinase